MCEVHAGVPSDLYAAYPAVRAFHQRIASLPEVRFFCLDAGRDHAVASVPLQTAPLPVHVPAQVITHW